MEFAIIIVGIIVGIIVFLAVVGTVIDAFKEVFITRPANKRAQEAKEQAIKDHYANLDAMPVEDHRAELVKAEKELRAEVVAYAEECRLWDFNEQLLSSDFRRANYYGHARIPFEQQAVNRYWGHMIRIIQHESRCAENVAHMATNKAVDALITKWAMEVINRRKAEFEIRRQASAKEAEHADSIATKYIGAEGR